jgi:serine/threonine-protein kinase
MTALSAGNQKMGLSSGTRLGPYEIRSLLGAGGMGEVYRARDTKLRRDVAIKILPDLFTDDPQRLVRFEREAQMLAALNHQHIAAIYGLEDANGVRALVLELIEGETLAQRLRQGSLALPEALAIARQIADALEAAHERGIVHRDLKPSNIKITPDGTVKVLDFGLAKAVTNDAGTSNLDQATTITADATSAGVILGTAAYMSPEQARGKPVDKRADIWAFGCVLYEMLAGHRAFSGDTTSDTIAAILEREPSWDHLPDAIPVPLRRLLRHCLEKDPKRRLRDIGDARMELEEALINPAQDGPVHEKPALMTRRVAIGALAGAAAGAAVGSLLGSGWRHSATPRSLTRFRIPLPEGSVAEASMNKRVAISSDGTQIAYSVSVPGLGTNTAANKFYLRSLRELEPKLVPAPGGTPFFSPNGYWLAFVGPGTPGTFQLRKIGLSGGAPVTLCTIGPFAGARWADDDSIYFVGAIPGGVSRIPASGGQPQEVSKIDFAKGERMHKYPCPLPHCKAVLFTVSTVDTESFDDARIVALNAQTGQTETLVDGGTYPIYSPSGHLVYARAGNLLAVRFDAKRLKVTGQPFTVLEGVLMSANSGVANYDISASSDLVYVPGSADKGARTLVWVDRHGKTEAFPLPPRAYLHPRFSPDMRQLAIEIEGPNHDFYIYDFGRGVLSKMTTDGVSHWPVWSPDGTQLVYRSGPMLAWRMWRVPADRSRPAEQLPGTGISQNAESWSPDGHAIAYTALTPEQGSHIMVESLEGDRGSQAFVDVKAPAGSPKFSPNGRWIAYCSNESGKAQVYVQAFPGPGSKVQVSNDGGTDPVWKKNGGELYFRNGDKMMVVAVSTAPTFTAGPPRALWEGHFSHGMSTSCGPPGATSSNYDVTPDGGRFLMIQDEAPDTAVSKHIVVVLDWADEVNRLSKF